jgi:hypothetical protein
MRSGSKLILYMNESVLRPMLPRSVLSNLAGRISLSPRYEGTSGAVEWEARCGLKRMIMYYFTVLYTNGHYKYIASD